jgi:purine-binding chemotaxis protein CheW
MPNDRTTPSREIDWAAARERLARARRVISGEAERSPDEVARVLDDRARALARPIEAGSKGEMIEVLTFTLSGERYAVESRCVFAAVRLEHITVVPSAEPPLVGLTAWRGELLALFDLRVLTGTSARPLSDLAWIVVLGDTSAAFGVLVDALHPVFRIPVSEIHPLPGGGAGTREYVRGVTSEALLVLDAGDLIRTYS